MSTTASLIFDLYKCEKKAVEIIDILINGGWRFICESNENKALYLPVYDVDDFNWQSEAISKEKLFAILNEKEKRKETIGISIVWEDTECGGELLIDRGLSVIFSLTINRKVLTKSEITDFNWYIERIGPCLQKENIIIERVRADHIV